ncbi:MAG: SH3 domain-containing protein [Gammaproteobacteria bacterium]
MMQIRVIFLLILPLLCTSIAYSDQSSQDLKIADPFLEIHTGPGGGYPVVRVIERGETVKVILRRTGWFKIITEDAVEGWVEIEQLEQTLMPDGNLVEFQRKTRDDFTQRNWELGVMGGDFGGATQFSAYGAYLINRGFAAELGYAEAIGANSSSQLLKIGLLMQPFPSWRVSPYFYLGTGYISVRVNETIAVPNNRDNQFSNVGIGIRTFITKNIIFRAEIGDYILFSADVDNDTNEDITEWKLGFAVFF